MYRIGRLGERIGASVTFIMVVAIVIRSRC